jgi:phage shock protein C
VNRRLYRSRTDRVMQGVAGGVAEYLDVDSTIVRVIWALLALVTGGLFAALYIVMWAIVPEGPAPATPAEGGAGGVDPTTGQPVAASPLPAAQPIPRHRRGSGSGSYVVGLILVGVGLYFLIREYFPAINLDRLWPLGLVALGVVLLVVAMRRRPE